jgi:Tfp pilus assembly protein PilV
MAFYGRAVSLKLDEAPAEAVNVPHCELVMIDTYLARLPDPRSPRGDTLIEVVISAMLLAVIVVGTLTGLNSANRATSEDRARSQADVLAQQEEEQFRSLPILKLSELSVTHEPVVHEVDASGTKYLITSTAKYISDATATSSCNASTPNANYIQTTSEVTWKPLGTGKPVIETSIISPPPDAAIIARVTDAAGEPVPGMSVASTGPSSLSTATSANGCAILAVLPGEYKLNVFKAGYVDQNGYQQSKEDPVSNSPFYVTAEETVKVPFEFDQAGTLEVTFQDATTGNPTEGDSFVVANNGMNPAFRTFDKPGIGVYSHKLSTEATLFPFTTKYSVYAGTCELDNPHVVNSANGEPPTVSVVGGAIAAQNVALPPVNVAVWTGTPSAHGTQLVGATGIVTDTGCHTERSFATVTGGALPHPNLPFGKYTMCVEYSGKKWEHAFENSTTAGPPANWTGEGMSGSSALIYMSAPGNTSVGNCT